MNLKSLKSIQHPHDIHVFQSAFLLLVTDPKSFISTIFGEACRLQDLGLTTLGWKNSLCFNTGSSLRSLEIFHLLQNLGRSETYSHKKTNPKKSHLKKQHKKNPPKK